MNLQQRKTVLILSANPKDTRRLRDDEEIRTIKEILQHSKHHENFKVETELATPVADLQSILLRHSPHIVHFCGHGEADGLLFEDETGKKQQVPVDDLAELFAICIQECEKPIECLMLNACYSEAQAEAIHQHIPYVIGMNASIGDKAAIRFAEGFYTGLGEGYSYPTAFRLGCNNIGLHNIPEGSIPVILEQQNTTLLQAEDVDYEWDVFLSYEPGTIFDEWREKTLLHRFKGLLKQLVGTVKIFERKELCTGEEVPAHVKNALARSRCFVGICSPTYFNCYQCRYELSVMFLREQRLGYRTANNPNPLILIVNVFDGNKFPDHIRRIAKDWDFNGLTLPGIIYGRKSGDLEERIIQLVTATEKAMSNAPVWNNTLFDDLVPDETFINALQHGRKFPIPRH